MNEALDTRLARAATHGDAARLAQLIADLEGADWAVLYATETDLLAAVASLTTAPVLRVDPRLPLASGTAAAAGLRVESFEADWRGSGAVWLADVDDRALKRARKADVKIIVDGAFHTPRALERGAALVAYRDAAALTGFTDANFSVLVGLGDQPALPDRAPAGLTVTLALRDLATLRARRAEQARTAAQLAERLGARADLVSPTTLQVHGELPGTRLFAAGVPLGGVTSARLDVPGGAVLSVGLEDTEDLWRDLSGDVDASNLADEATPETLEPESAAPTEASAEAAFTDDAATDDAATDGTSASTAAEQEAAEETPSAPAPLTPDLPDAPDVAAGESADPTQGLTDEQLATFERLREWRNAEARRQEVSRFIIASNATLAEIARHAPQTEAELRQVRGMGPERVRKYAGVILNMLRGARA